MTNQLVGEVNQDEAPVPEVPSSRNGRSRGSVRFGWGQARFEAHIDFTPATMLAIGGMVGMILLSVAPIVTAAGKAKRRQ